MTPTPPRPTDARADQASGRSMQSSLGALLDRVPGSRDVVPHLAALEHALGALGASAIESLASARLTRICGQLASLPLPEGDVPLEALQDRLMKALANSGAAPPTGVAAAPPTAAAAVPAKTPVKVTLARTMPFVDSQLLSVVEASMTDFDAVVTAQRAQDGLDL